MEYRNNVFVTILYLGVRGAMSRSLRAGAYSSYMVNYYGRTSSTQNRRPEFLSGPVEFPVVACRPRKTRILE